MTLRIQYRDKKYDYVSSHMLDRLIRGKEIKQFYRPSEKKWVNVDLDPIRGKGGSAYTGGERRQILCAA